MRRRPDRCIGRRSTRFGSHDARVRTMLVIGGSWHPPRRSARRSDLPAHAKSHIDQRHLCISHLDSAAGSGRVAQHLHAPPVFGRHLPELVVIGRRHARIALGRRRIRSATAVRPRRVVTIRLAYPAVRHGALDLGPRRLVMLARPRGRLQLAEKVAEALSYGLRRLWLSMNHDTAHGPSDAARDSKTRRASGLYRGTRCSASTRASRRAQQRHRSE